METFRPLASGPLRHTFSYIVELRIMDMKRSFCSLAILNKSSVQAQTRNGRLIGDAQHTSKQVERTSKQVERTE